MSSSSPSAGATVDLPDTYRERLWPGLLGWSFVPGFAVFALIALLPVDLTAALVAAGVTAAAAVVVAVRTSTVVGVHDGELHVGAAHIPVTLLGDGQTLGRDGVRAALGPGSDARAFVCVRGWIAGAVVLPVTDPQDPTPTWLVSSRRPAQLLAAVDGARGRAQAAHSEQIS